MRSAERKTEKHKLKEKEGRGERERERDRQKCQDTSSFPIAHLLRRSVHVQLHGAVQCTLDRGLEPNDSCQQENNTETCTNKRQTNSC